MEQTLLVLKPDATMRRGVSAAVLEHLMEVLPDVAYRGFLEIVVPQKLAEEHYAVHQGKFFYPWLQQFIQVGKVIATVLWGETIVSRLREVLGATFVEKADPESLRGKYGIVGGVNVAHASDEPVNAEKEIALWEKKTNLELDVDGRDLILAYIAKWRETPVVATQQIRGFTQEYAQYYCNRDYYLGLIAEFLVEECPGWTELEIQNLADAILGNMDLDREKS